MPVTAQWDDDAHQNIFWLFTAPWHWNDLLEVIENQVFPMLASVEHRVHHLADVSQTGLPRDSLMSMKPIASRIRANPRGDGMVVFIGANVMLRGIAQVFMRLYPQFSNETHFVDSADEARTLISRRRAEIARNH